jgi:hypothetical protein
MIAFQVSDMTSHRSAGVVTEALKAVVHRALVRADMATFTVEIGESRASARELSERHQASWILTGGSVISAAGHLDRLR